MNDVRRANRRAPGACYTRCFVSTCPPGSSQQPARHTYARNFLSFFFFLTSYCRLIACLATNACKKNHCNNVGTHPRPCCMLVRQYTSESDVCYRSSVRVLEPINACAPAVRLFGTILIDPVQGYMSVCVRIRTFTYVGTYACWCQ